MDWSNSKKTIVKRNWTRVGGHISSGKTIYKAVSGPSDSLCASFRVVVLACCSPACHTQGLTQRKKKWAVGDWRKVVTRFLWPYHGTNRLFFFTVVLRDDTGHSGVSLKMLQSQNTIFLAFIWKKRWHQKYKGKGSEILQATFRISKFQQLYFSQCWVVAMLTTFFSSVTGAQLFLKQMSF